MALDADNSGHFNKSEFHRSLTTLGVYRGIWMQKIIRAC